MSTALSVYCLDANVLIQAWQKYYSPKFCSDYWEILSSLGKKGRLFLPEMVYEEIIRTDDDLTDWLKGSAIPRYKPDESVVACWKEILEKDPIHKFLVDNTKNRSLADPWVIAHAMKEKACVVTKEEKINVATSLKIKIPNVCDNMGVPWINDFQLVEELNIHFSCKILPKLIT
jgi:Domain of unknown function (DUF4411)